MAMACWIACNKIRSIFSRSSVEPRFFLQRMLHTGTNLLARFQQFTFLTVLEPGNNLPSV